MLGSDHTTYLIRPIAEGGMGRVDLVVRQDGAFRRLFAAKRLRSAFRDDPAFRNMFKDEARLAGLIQHANVVGVLDVGEDEEGPFLLMEYIDGVPVVDLIRQARKTGSPLPLPVVLEIAAAAATGLHAAHIQSDEHGQPLSLVHRDVSPQNLLVGFDGVVRVTDFGIAKAFGRSSVTTVGTIKGKLGYLSPEQLRFEPVDQRSDLFSLGIVLYEMLTSRRLYPNRDGNGPRRILQEPPPDVGLERDDVPNAVVELVFDLLAKEADDRPATAKEVADVLASACLEARLLAEPEVSLVGFMQTSFPKLREERSEQLKAAFLDLDAGALPTWRTSPPVPQGGRAPMRWWVAPAAGLLLLGLGVGMGVGGSAWDSEDPPVPDSPAPTSEPPQDMALAGDPPASLGPSPARREVPSSRPVRSEQETAALERPPRAEHRPQAGGQADDSPSRRPRRSRHPSRAREGGTTPVEATVTAPPVRTPSERLGAWAFDEERD